MKKAIEATVEELIRDVSCYDDPGQVLKISCDGFWYIVQDFGETMPSGGCGETLREALIAYGKTYWSERKRFNCFSKNLDWSDLT